MRLRDRRVQMSYPVRLTCQVSGHPEPDVTWYKNREEIFQDGKKVNNLQKKSRLPNNFNLKNDFFIFTRKRFVLGRRVALPHSRDKSLDYRRFRNLYGES